MLTIILQQRLLHKNQLHKFLHMILFLQPFSCLTAFNTTKHTYSRSVGFSDSCLLQEPGALGHHEDQSLHSRFWYALEAPRALAPTGPLTRRTCPDKEFPSCYLQILCNTIYFKDTSTKWVN